jgi:hypothetical protein
MHWCRAQQLARSRCDCASLPHQQHAAITPLRTPATSYRQAALSCALVICQLTRARHRRRASTCAEHCARVSATRNTARTGTTRAPVITRRVSLATNRASMKPHHILSQRARLAPCSVHNASAMAGKITLSVNTTSIWPRSSPIDVLTYARSKRCEAIAHRHHAQPWRVGQHPRNTTRRPNRPVWHNKT